MTSNLAEIQSKFGGTWELDRSENLDAFLTEMGLGKMKKMMASKAKPTLLIEVKDEKLVVTRKVLLKDSVVAAALGVPTPVEQEGHKIIMTATYEDDKLIVKVEPQKDDKDPVKPNTVVREISSDGEMVQTMTVNSVVCKRIFKKR